MAHVVLMFIGVAVTSATMTIPAASDLVLTQGLVLRDAATGNVSFDWEGVQFSFAVTDATQVTLSAVSTFAHYGLLHSFVDGVIVANISLAHGAPQQYVVASGLDASHAHNLTLWYATDPIAMGWPYIPAAVQTFTSLSTDGAFVPPPTRRTRRLLIIGDSITAGNQINRTTCAPDHAFTYGAQLCEYFDANCTTTAISGKGLYENCCDGNETMAAIFRRVFAFDASRLWDAADVAPDAVLLNLGTNDMNHDNGSAWQDGFINTYAQFVYNLTQLFSRPQLPVFCGVGPITHSYEPLVVQAMALAKSRYNVASTTFVNYTTVLDGCGHPGFVGHDEMFAIAEPIVASVMGW